MFYMQYFCPVYVLGVWEAYQYCWLVCSLATPGLRYIGPVCIRFTYHMNGDGVGSLLVYTRFHGGITNPVFNQSSQLGDRWVEAAVDAVLIYAESVRYFLLPMRRMRICFTDVFFFFLFFFRSPQNTRQLFSGTAERIFMKLLPNDNGHNVVSNVVPKWGLGPD